MLVPNELVKYCKYLKIIKLRELRVKKGMWKQFLQ